MAGQYGKKVETTLMMDFSTEVQERLCQEVTTIPEH